MSVAFVLSGGASLGAIQVGMLRALLGHGVRPDMIVGTSVGALNGAFLACRDVNEQTVDELGALWLEVRRGHVFPVAPLSGLLGVLGARSNLVPVGPLRQLVLGQVDCEKLEDLPTPLHVIACDVRTGAEIRLSEGPLVDAVLASAALPGVFPPVAWGDQLLVDGGVINNTPLTHALELGADEVYVLSTGGPCTLTKPPRGALATLIHATSLLVGQRFAVEALAIGARPGVTILPPPCPVDVHPTDFSRPAELMARAEAAARAFLEEHSADVVGLREHRRKRDPPTGLDGLPAAG
ncbi:MAG TPA: patatin-like phospholipase family protein [Gemmatimonadaceae bacterium]|nr:patatin-like phospholipase family protein [Gemmatimonadaceae bacterium]